MKLRIVLMALSLSLLLSSCAGLLNRSYSAEGAHSQFANADKNSKALQASNYQGLVGALIFLISNGEEGGIIRLHDYVGEAERDIDTACLELTKQDPLGAYAVDYIKYDMARLDAYVEIDVKLVYQRSWQQIAAVSTVTGSSAIVGELRTALLDFQKEKVLRVSYFDPKMTAEGVRAMVEEAYDDVPEAAFGMPEVKVLLYPEQATQQQRIVEILLDYPVARETLKAQQLAMNTRVQELLRPLTQRGEMGKIVGAIESLHANAQLVPDAGARPYDALIDGAANAEGFVLAAKLLLQKSDLQCRMVRGSMQGATHRWLVVQTSEGWQHLDPTQMGVRLYGDGAMQTAGYRWSGDIPVCRDFAQAP